MPRDEDNRDTLSLGSETGEQVLLQIHVDEALHLTRAPSSAPIVENAGGRRGGLGSGGMGIGRIPDRAQGGNFLQRYVAVMQQAP